MNRCFFFWLIYLCCCFRWYQPKIDWRVWLHSRRRGVLNSRASEAILVEYLQKLSQSSASFSPTVPLLPTYLWIKLYQHPGDVRPQDIRADPGWCILNPSLGEATVTSTYGETKWIHLALNTAYNTHNFCNLKHVSNAYCCLQCEWQAISNSSLLD